MSNNSFSTLKIPVGYRAAGLHVGIKSTGAHDMALFVSDIDATSAAIFTTNKVTAAPVRLSINHLKNSNYTARAVVVTSGNANAATGKKGYENAAAICDKIASRLGCDPTSVLIAQTGLIGVPLCSDTIVSGASSITERLSYDSWEDAARGMMTTDTFPKSAYRQFEFDGELITVTGFAKGVAMAAPSMATMIVTLFTDAAVEFSALDSLLRYVADKTFHQLNIDGCRSTNDTLFCLANGASRAKTINVETKEPLQKALLGVCEDLVKQMAGDAEGATKLIKVAVEGALSDSDANRVARQVVGSVLVKCAIAGECPYWGRVIAEVGAAGVSLDPDNIAISFGDILLCEKSEAIPFDNDSVTRYLKGGEVQISVNLNQGSGRGQAYGSDLTPEYVRINMEKS
jgi:glutamate N-acetyltransferase/amino-acid N-acetyltransferase